MGLMGLMGRMGPMGDMTFMKPSRIRGTGWGIFCALCWLGCLPVAQSWAANEGELEIRVIDKSTDKPIAARMHVRDAKGKTVPPTQIVPPKTVWWNDHFNFDGTIKLKLKPGSYRYEIERGPEYRLSF